MSNWTISLTPRFKKEAKKLFKRYPSLKNDLAELGKALLQNPTLGTPLGNNAYKIRLAIRSKGKGKSGGARVITYIVSLQQSIFLLSIYDKSEISTLDDKTLKKLISDISH